ncbi:MAG: ABC transporter substrate-binding protein [Acetobacteraceae bacterium]|nr:ABC transporter substrate-binding protein [Acetobacteraceae bacterium]
MLNRRTFLAASAATLAAPRILHAADTTGVTATEIKIGNIMPYSGPASSYGAIGKLEQVFFRVVNEQGGIAGRKINYITYDDGYSPPKTVEQARRLIEQDRVAYLFNTLGTPTNSAILRYVNQRKVPHVFLATGADKWGDYKEHPWTIGWQPSYRTEAQIYTKYMLEQKPQAKLALLYQNDDFGKDYVLGVRDILGDRFDQMVKTASYEVTDATIDSQIVSLQASGSDVLMAGATPKFAAQAIRKVHDIGWKPMFFMTNVSISVGSVIQPAGPEKAVGIITSAYLKDATDPAWKDDPGMKEWRAFMNKYMPDADQTDGNYVYSYGVSKTLMQVLHQCGNDFSRENFMKQVTNLKDLEIPTLLPGIKVNTSPTNYHPIRQMQLQKWNGSTWERFGNVIEGAEV